MVSIPYDGDQKCKGWFFSFADRVKVAHGRKNDQAATPLP